MNRDDTKKRTVVDLLNNVANTEDIGVMNDITQHILNVILTSAKHC